MHLEMQLPGLCSVCQGCLLKHEGLLYAVEEDALEQMWMFKAHVDIDSFIASRETGCTICVLLWRLLSEEQRHFLPRLALDEMLTYLTVWKDSALASIGVSVEKSWFLAVEFWELPEEWPGTEPHLQFLLEPAVGMYCSFLTASALFSPPPLMISIGAAANYPKDRGSDSTSSEATWQLATQWIGNCLSNHHESCSNQLKRDWYPTRLLDVGKQEDDYIRLVNTSEVLPGCGYVTLSHSWGAAQVFKLTKLTAGQLEQGIPLASLPLTFQHAVMVTRKLQHKYIWIDSLCIYQDEDDKSDWLKEAFLMDKVYTNCVVNIAATGAKDSTSGLFATTRVPQIELEATKVSWLGEEYILTDWMLLERELRSAPLNQRGWVLQERLLSPRILHFGSKQLFWECNEGVLCERFPTVLPPAMQNTTMAHFSSLTRLRRRADDRKLSGAIGDGQATRKIGLGDAYALWGAVVQSYSRSALTFSSDKLVAISGIAKVTREALKNDEYIAGMWGRYLASHLLWYVDKTSQVDGTPSTREFTYRAPTWSWLSVDGNVSFPLTRENESLLIEVVDVDVRYSTEDTTGPVSSGTSLILRGRLRPLELRKAVVKPSDLGDDILVEAAAKGLCLDELAQEVPGAWVMKVGGKDLELAHGELEDRLGPIVSLDVPASSFEESNRCQELFIMSAGGPYTEPIPHHFHEILILKCVDKETGRFTRIGFAKLDTEEKGEILEELKVLDDCESRLPCVEYDAEKHSHTIILE